MTQVNNILLDEIKSRLKETLNPKKIYLFGSRSRGDARADSDYDLLVVVDESQKLGKERKVSAREILRDIDASIDIFVYTEKEFDEWKDELSSIPETALHEGRELDLG